MTSAAKLSECVHLRALSRVVATGCGSIFARRGDRVRTPTAKGEIARNPNAFLPVDAARRLEDHTRSPGATFYTKQGFGIRIRIYTNKDFDRHTNKDFIRIRILYE